MLPMSMWAIIGLFLCFRRLRFSAFELNNLIESVGYLLFLLGDKSRAQISFRLPHFQKAANQVPVGVPENVPLSNRKFVKFPAAVVLVSLVQLSDQCFYFFFV